MNAPARLLYGQSYWDLLKSIDVSGISLRESSYEENMCLPSHAHLRAGFHLVVNGGYTEIAGGKRDQYSSRNVAFLPPGHEHRVDVETTGARCFCIELHPRWLARVPDDLSLPEQSKRLETGPIPLLMVRIYNEFLRMDPFSPLAIEALTLETMVAFGRNGTESIDRLPPLWLQKARDLLHSRYSESLGATEIASAVGVHPGHLTRAFRAHFRCTIGEYVRRIRIEAACQSLTRTRKGLAEIAFETGFADQSHFSRAFRLLTETSPAQYRQNMRR
jgi:AraC family transcriptional regulator